MALQKVHMQIFTRIPALVRAQNNFIHTSSNLQAWTSDNTPKKWLGYNRVVFPPQKEGEERRPAYVCHQKTNIKYSPLKMWYIASFIRGMSVDEAIRQLKFVLKKGALDVRQTLEEAKELAVKEHNVEFGSNLWVAESFVGKGPVIKGMRRHARQRFGIVHYKHCHYFVRLEEGTPPKNYYQTMAKEPHQQLEDWISSMRKRKIIGSL